MNRRTLALLAVSELSTGSHLPEVGPVVTAGRLIFTGTRDHKVRALDSATAKVLWEAEAGAALEGMPAVYQIDGRYREPTSRLHYRLGRAGN